MCRWGGQGAERGEPLLLLNCTFLLKRLLFIALGREVGTLFPEFGSQWHYLDLLP